MVRACLFGYSGTTRRREVSAAERRASRGILADDGSRPKGRDWGSVAMNQVCPHCNSTIRDDNSSCPNCGEELDAFKTIAPPRFGSAPSAPAKPEPATPSPMPPRPAPETARHDAERRTEPVAEPKPRPRPKSRPRPPEAQAPRPAPLAPQPPPAMPAQPPYAYPAPPPQYPPEPDAAPGKLRRWLIGRLGGSAAPPPPPGYGYAPAAPPSYPQAPPQPQWGAPAQPQPVTPHPGAGPLTPQSHEYAPPPLPPNAPVEVEEEARTMAFGADLAKFKVASSLLILQIFDRGGKWHDWTQIGAGGVKIGRPEKATKFAELSSMAVKHMRIGLDGDRLVVEDLGSVNGVYVKINRSVDLVPGSRFRVGSQVIDFEAAEPFPPAETLVGEDGEAWWSCDLDAAAYLQFLRTDGRPGLRIPITKPDVTILGRESRSGKPVDIALPSDEWASGRHAQIRRDGDRFYLEDLGSRNGTFLQLKGVSEILPGDILLVGRVLLRAIDPSRPPR